MIDKFWLIDLIFRKKDNSRNLYKKVKLAESIDLDSIAQATSGFVGADLANMVNEAALLAARAKKKVLNNKI